MQFNICDRVKNAWYSIDGIIYLNYWVIYFWIESVMRDEQYDVDFISLF